MNEHVRPPTIAGTTQAAEGLPRRRWKVAEVRKAIESGIIDEDENFELLGGEIVPMAPKGNRYERLRHELNMHWGRARPDTVKFGAEAPIELSDYDWPEPDFLFHSAAVQLKDVNGASVLLTVEISDSSLYKDIRLKASIYCTFGVREYWVVNTKTLMTTVHKLPSANGYGSVVEVPSTRMLIPEFVPEMSVRLGDLDLS